jgi:tetratricopeptide (TPR) repeat protein
VISLADILAGYEIRYKNYLKKNDIDSAKKEMEKILRSLDEEGAMPSEYRQIRKIFLNLFDSYISISDILDAARTFDYLVGLKTDLEQIKPKAITLIKDAYTKKTNIDKTLKTIREIYSNDKEVIETLDQTTKSQAASVKMEKVEVRAAEKKEEIKDRKAIEMALELAGNYEKKNNFTLALDIITDLLKTYPTNNDALKIKARLELKLKKAEPLSSKTETKAHVVETKPVETKPVETKPVETKPVENENPVDDIIKIIDSGDLVRANQKSLEMISKNPKEPKYWLLRAIIAYKNKDINAYQNFISYASRLDKNIMNDNIFKRFFQK